MWSATGHNLITYNYEGADHSIQAYAAVPSPRIAAKFVIPPWMLYSANRIIASLLAGGQMRERLAAVSSSCSGSGWSVNNRLSVDDFTVK